MDTLITLIAIIIALLSVSSIRAHKRYAKIRFQLFRLRDDILWMAIEGHISKDIAIKHYNTINWAIRYVREFPVFFLFGLANAIKELSIPENENELREKIGSLPPELQNWYREFSEISLECIHEFTPLGIAMRGPKIGGVIMFSSWLLLRLFYLRRHPLQKSDFGVRTFLKRKKESQQSVAKPSVNRLPSRDTISQTHQTVWNIKEATMSISA